MNLGHCTQALRRMAECAPAECLRGVSGIALELCPERLLRVPHVKRLLHSEPPGRSVAGPLPEPNGHLWRDWRATRQDSMQELS